jgi:hypothetical protein
MIRAKNPAQWLLGVAVGVDQLFNAIFSGDPHATISSRAYEATLKNKTWACVLCKLLDYIQKDHCHVAWESEMAADTARLAAEDPTT